MLRTIALTGLATLLAATAVSLAPPARAQIGSIFSDPLPRPPGNIPRGYQLPPDDEEEVPELLQGRVLPTPNRPLPGHGVPPPGSVQSQPLAPPPGTSVRGALDDERRSALMRTHSSLHLLNGVVYRDFDLLVTSAGMEPLDARMDFDLPTVPEGFRGEVVAGPGYRARAGSSS